jgi:16S rRNA U1498 N3-methylase RsmE
MAEKEDWKPVTLGPTILRAETAAIVAIGIVQHRLGNLG